MLRGGYFLKAKKMKSIPLADVVILAVTGVAFLVCAQVAWSALRERRNNKRIAQRFDDYDPPYAV